MGGHLHIQIAGELAVRRDGRAVAVAGRKQRLVLAALVVAGGRPVPAARLVELVWGDAPPARAEATLQSYISRLRAALEPSRSGPPSVLVTRPGGYVLVRDTVTLDVDARDALATRGLAAHAAGRHDEAVAALGAALDGWGPVLADLHDAPFVVELARRDDARRGAVQEAWLDARVARGDHVAVVPDLQEAVRHSPRREHLWALLALALYRGSRQADALAALAEARAVLRAEAGVEPSPALRRLEAAVLAQCPTLELVPSPAPRAAPARPGRARCGHGRRVAPRRVAP